MLLDRIDLDDVFVPNLGRRPGLAHKPFAGGRGAGQLRGQHLDRDHALQRLVEGAQHDAEPATTEDFEDLVVSDPPEGIRPPGRGEELEVGVSRVRIIVCVRRGAQLLGGEHVRLRWLDGRASQEAAGRVMRPEQGVDASPPCRVAAANPVQVSGTGRSVGEVEHGQEDFTFGHRQALGRTRHGTG